MSNPARARIKAAFRRPVIAFLLAGLICLLAAAGIALFQHPQPHGPAKTEARQERQQEPAKPTHEESRHAQRATMPERRELPGRVVNAAWYPVPVDSLAKRRAGEQELTAAHNSLPLGTRVRVTHLVNGKSVVVRITDRGIRNRRIGLDLCKEAAEELQMLEEGIARVRLQVLAREPAVASAADWHDQAAEP